MKPWQFNIRWLLGVTLIAAIYAVFVRGALFSDPQHATNWRFMLLGLTLYILLSSIQALASGTFFHDVSRSR